MSSRLRQISPRFHRGNERSRSLEYTPSRPAVQHSPRSISTGSIAPKKLRRLVVDTQADHPLVWDTYAPATDPKKEQTSVDQDESVTSRLFKSIFGFDSDRDREISDDFTLRTRSRDKREGCTLIPPVRSARPKFMDEYRKTLRAFFSVSSGGEVELKELSAVRELPRSTPSTLTRTISLRTFERMVAIQEEDQSDVSDSPRTSNVEPTVVETRPELLRVKLMAWLRRYAWSEDDERLLESLRLQPFASGAFLRGMLLGGFVAVIFHAYNLIYWNDLVVELRANNFALAENVIWGWIFVQVVIACGQLSARVNLYTNCWQVSRAADASEAIQRLHSIVHSDEWITCRFLGWCMDATVLIGLIVSEVILYMSDSTWTDAVRSAILPLCSTCLLGVFWRALLVSTFAATVHDPNAVREARKRGLSKYDMDRLTSFVYTCPAEVTNDQCPICLCGFDLGDMLTSLPCDKRHSFHAPCIRQWLERQNSCPLCQRCIS